MVEYRVYFRKGYQSPRIASRVISAESIFGAMEKAEEIAKENEWSLSGIIEEEIVQGW